MKQEHEMTPGVLVSGNDMSAGDYKARCAVLEAELAELRGRACVPDYLHDRIAFADRLYAAGWRDNADAQHNGAEHLRLELLAAAPAPVERVEQEAQSKVARCIGMRPGMGEVTVKVEDGIVSGWLDPGCTVYIYPTPQPAAHCAPPRDVIRATLMAHGFTVKIGQNDLKPYVYEAVEALFARPAPAAQDVAGLLALADAVTPQIIDWVRCGLSTNGHLTDGSHPALNKLREAYCALAHQSGGAK